MMTEGRGRGGGTMMSLLQLKCPNTLTGTAVGHETHCGSGERERERKEQREREREAERESEERAEREQRERRAERKGERER
ncbi:hypothetical protein J4Q44_G00347950, partial [Coregonus suidteri]